MNALHLPKPRRTSLPRRAFFVLSTPRAASASIIAGWLGDVQG